MADERKMAFASATTVLSIAADVSDDEFDAGTQTQLDNSTNLYPMALAEFYAPNGFTGGSWDTSPYIELHLESQDIGGGTDDETPVLPTGAGATYKGAPVGVFRLDSPATASTAQRKTCVFSLAGVQKADFRIKNVTGRTLDYVSTAITVKVYPFTLGT